MQQLAVSPALVSYHLHTYLYPAVLLVLLKSHSTLHHRRGHCTWARRRGVGLLSQPALIMIFDFVVTAQETKTSNAGVIDGSIEAQFTSTACKTQADPSSDDSDQDVEKVTAAVHNDTLNVSVQQTIPPKKICRLDDAASSGGPSGSNADRVMNRMDTTLQAECAFNSDLLSNLFLGDVFFLGLAQAFMMMRRPQPVVPPTLQMLSPQRNRRCQLPPCQKPLLPMIPSWTPCRPMAVM